MNTTAAKIAVEEMVHALNRCIEACANGQQGYATAAADAKDTDLKILFQKYSDARAAFVLQLQEAIRELGGRPESHGSLAGAAHRSWLDLRLTVGGRADSVVLQECARGDEAALGVFESALPSMLEMLPSRTRQLVHGQHASIRASLDEIESRLRIAQG